MELNKNIPWVEKYRPKTIDKILDQNKVTKMLQKSLNNKSSIPNLLFFGSSGTGKTTVALALCNQLFGIKNFKDRVLELNASDERGIKIVRNKIKSFAKKKLILMKIALIIKL